MRPRTAAVPTAATGIVAPTGVMIGPAVARDLAARQITKTTETTESMVAQVGLTLDPSSQSWQVPSRRPGVGGRGADDGGRGE